jgi:hypothetical protein
MQLDGEACRQRAAFCILHRIRVLVLLVRGGLAKLVEHW